MHPDCRSHRQTDCNQMDDKQALFACKNELRRLMFQFNFLPAGYLHPSYRESFFPGMPEKIWEVPRVLGKLSALILRKLEYPEPIFTPNHWGWPVALLPQSRLVRLASLIGAISFRDQVRSSLARDHVMSWKRKLGIDAYQFAMTSASLLPSVSTDDMCAGEISPEAIGYSVISASIQTMPNAMLERVRLKLPSTFESLEFDPLKARRIVASVLDISEGKWSSSHAATY